VPEIGNSADFIVVNQDILWRASTPDPRTDNNQQASFAPCPTPSIAVTS
jgi:hypothetical protein